MTSKGTHKHTQTAQNCCSTQPPDSSPSDLEKEEERAQEEDEQFNSGSQVERSANDYEIVNARHICEAARSRRSESQTREPLLAGQSASSVLQRLGFQRDHTTVCAAASVLVGSLSGVVQLWNTLVYCLVVDDHIDTEAQRLLLGAR